MLKDNRTLSVLLDTRSRHWNQNPYISLLSEALSPNTQLIGFSWRRALLGRYSVVHLHWPEYLTRHDSKLVRITARLFLFLWIVRISLTNTPIVKTVHNLAPHQKSTHKIDRLLLGQLQRLYCANVWLQEPELSGYRSSLTDVVIPHGNYNKWVREVVRTDQSQHLFTQRTSSIHLRLLCFGILREYKNIHEPIEALKSLPLANVMLKIAGAAPDSSYFSSLESSAAGDPRIELSAGRVSDAELVAIILASDVVVVPYADVFNSGVVLLALTLGRPVAMKSNQITEDLKSEYGHEWIITYRDTFDTEVLEQLLGSASELGGPVPPMSPKRSWTEIALKHQQVYKQVIGSAPGSIFASGVRHRKSQCP